jgi:hypothetical protein
MIDQTMPPQLCLKCGYFLDGWSNAGGPAHRPKPGDEALCVNCGAVAFFDAHLKLREPSQHEMGDPRLQYLLKIGKRSASMARGVDLREKKGSA